FQAEDGIRDRTVTGVQTCALPIFGKDPAARRDVTAALRTLAHDTTDHALAARSVLLGAVVAATASPPDHATVAELLDGFEKRYPDRKSTRLNSSHRTISYAVFCLK